MGASALGEGRRGRNIRHHLPGLLRQAVYGRLAGYEDVNDAERLACDPVMRAIGGREGMDRPAASTSHTEPRNGVLAEVDPGLQTHEATGWVGDRGQQHKDDRKRLLLLLQLGLPVKRELASSSSVLVIARAGRGWSRGAVLM